MSPQAERERLVNSFWEKNQALNCKRGAKITKKACLHYQLSLEEELKQTEGKALYNSKGGVLRRYMIANVLCAGCPHLVLSRSEKIALLRKEEDF